jgi:hypothetical protein
VAKAEPTESKASAGRSWRCTPLRSPTRGSPPYARVRARGDLRPAPRLEGGLTYRRGLDRAPAQPLRPAIRKRAKANGWTRDLSGAVRSRVREEVGVCELAGIAPSA